QQIVATEHDHSEAIGCIDETGTAKSGRETAGVKRQYNGNRGKLENCINNVALAYSVRRAANVVVSSMSFPPRTREELYRAEADRQHYHTRRNAQASQSHRKTRRKRLAELGIDPKKIKSVPPKPPLS
ncbi:MAG: transposase, partial [Fuerstiella sp.]